MKQKLDDIIVPFLGGTIKFLKAIDYVRKNGSPGHLDDRVEIYGDTRTPAVMTPSQFSTMIKAIENRDDIMNWLDTLVVEA